MSNLQLDVDPPWTQNAESCPDVSKIQQLPFLWDSHVTLLLQSRGYCVCSWRFSLLCWWLPKSISIEIYDQTVRFLLRKSRDSSISTEIYDQTVQLRSRNHETQQLVSSFTTKLSIFWPDPRDYCVCVPRNSICYASDTLYWMSAHFGQVLIISSTVVRQTSYLACRTIDVMFTKYYNTMVEIHVDI